jgi:beta-1,4-N-acetylglucosaminyltransferase
MSRKKALLVGSSGGHLLQLLRAKDALRDWELVWVCFKKTDAEYFLSGYRTYWCYFPTTRNLWNLLRNTLQAVRVMYKERPDVVISSGAGVAIPYFYLAKLVGMRTIYIESFTRVKSASLTGRLVYPVTDLFCIQWESLRKIYPRATVIGRLP